MCGGDRLACVAGVGNIAKPHHQSGDPADCASERRAGQRGFEQVIAVELVHCRKKRVVLRDQSGDREIARDRLAGDLCGGKGRRALGAGHVACQRAGEIRRAAGGGGGGGGGSAGCRRRASCRASDQGVGRGKQPLIGSHQLEAIAPVVEPHPQADVGVVHATGGHSRHVWQGAVSQRDGVEALGDGQRHGCGGLGTGLAGAVVAPITLAAVRVDQGKFELAIAIKIDAVDGDAALVIEGLRHARNC